MLLRVVVLPQLLFILYRTQVANQGVFANQIVLTLNIFKAAIVGIFKAIEAPIFQ